jgi:hypothetical protein
MKSDAPVIEKRGTIFTDADPSDPRVINEMARDSWPKLIPSETEVVDTDGDIIVYRGPADGRLYDEDDYARMRRADTVTVVESADPDA